MNFWCRIFGHNYWPWFDHENKISVRKCRRCGCIEYYDTKAD